MTATTHGKAEQEGDNGRRKKVILKLPEEADELLSIWEGYPGRTGAALAIGGGTILVSRWGHRRSIDLDLFLNERDWNEHYGWGYGVDALRNHFTVRCGYGEPRKDANAVKIGPMQVMDEGRFGSIDIIGLHARAGHVEDGKDTVWGKRAYAALDTWSILAGKLLHRGALALDRDVYDLAVACRRERSAALRATRCLRPAELEMQANRLERKRKEHPGRVAVEGATDEEAVDRGLEEVAELYAETRQWQKRREKERER